MSTSNKKQQAILFIDGECPVCNKFAEYVIHRDPKGHFRFARLKYITENKSSVILIKDGQLYDQSTAILKTLVDLKGFSGKLGYIGLIFPKFLRDFFYRIFAKHRLRFFQESETCSLDLRKRLIEKEDISKETLKIGLSYS